jgi:hypothetical protein
MRWVVLSVLVLVMTAPASAQLFHEPLPPYYVQYYSGSGQCEDGELMIPFTVSMIAEYVAGGRVVGRNIMTFTDGTTDMSIYYEDLTRYAQYLSTYQPFTTGFDPPPAGLRSYELVRSYYHEDALWTRTTYRLSCEPGASGPVEAATTFTVYRAARPFLEDVPADPPSLPDDPAQSVSFDVPEEAGDPFIVYQRDAEGWRRALVISEVDFQQIFRETTENIIVDATDDESIRFFYLVGGQYQVNVRSSGVETVYVFDDDFTLSRTYTLESDD